MTITAAPLRIVTGSQVPDLQDVPILVAHGDPDDHLRLTALLAHTLGGQAGGAQTADAVETCTRARSSWSKRREALSYLFQKAVAPERASYRAVLVDIDALDPGPPRAETLWDDRDFCRQRAEFLTMLLKEVNHGGFVLVRPRPSTAVSLELESHHSDENDSSDMVANPSLDAMLDVISPECRPVLLWIINSTTLRMGDLILALEREGSSGFDRFVLGVAYEAIPYDARMAARRLSALRGFQPVDRMAEHLLLLGESSGSTPIEPNMETTMGPDATTRAIRAVHWLKQCGFLQPGSAKNGHTGLRMPRAVRNFLMPLARLSIPDIVKLQHRAWGSVPLGGLSLEEQLEAHHHAVEGGVLKDALSTAVYYANDLRDLALQLSHEGQFAESAEVYRRVKEIDAEDAHAWEYFALNLALASGDDMPARRAEEVEAAYERAYELDRKNPLYHGRLLGFRAERNIDVRAEFHRGMKKYLMEYSDRYGAISYFAEQVLCGMKRGRWGAERDDLITPWRSVLMHHERLASLLGDGG